MMPAIKKFPLFLDGRSSLPYDAVVPEIAPDVLEPALL
jgi:hypothetical protein